MKRAISPRIRSVFTTLVAIGIVAVVAACTPDSGVTPEDSDVIVTLYDTDVNFQNIDTYALPDTIVHLSGDTTVTDNSLLTRAYDAFILGEIRQHFDDFGYTEVDTSASPDVGIVVLASAQKNYEAYTSAPSYGYWSWWGPGWSYNYNWATTTVYSFTSGTLIVLMVDPSTRNDAAREVDAYWAGAMNGAIAESSVSTQDRLENGINQMFKQSPYLDKN